MKRATVQIAVARDSKDYKPWGIPLLATKGKAMNTDRFIIQNIKSFYFLGYLTTFDVFYASLINEDSPISLGQFSMGGKDRSEADCLAYFHAEMLRKDAAKGSIQ